MLSQRGQLGQLVPAPAPTTYDPEISITKELIAPIIDQRKRFGILSMINWSLKGWILLVKITYIKSRVANINCAVLRWVVTISGGNSP